MHQMGSEEFRAKVSELTFQTTAVITFTRSNITYDLTTSGDYFP
jgi:hypothetical protein